MSRKTTIPGDIVYVVKMNRFSGKHSYVIGVYRKRANADKAAYIEEGNRGGTKYTAEIIELSFDKLPEELPQYV